MIKKILVLGFVFSSFNLLAIEANIKAGYDFFRNENKALEFNLNESKRGFKLGVEALVYNTKLIDLGFGIDYNLGEKSFIYGDASSYSIFIPVYGLAHVNLHQTQDNFTSVFLTNKLGVVAYRNGNNMAYSGVYYGFGLGFDYGYFTSEILYDGAFVPKDSGKEIKNKVGISVGVRLGGITK